MKRLQTERAFISYTYFSISINTRLYVFLTICRVIHSTSFKGDNKGLQTFVLSVWKILQGDLKKKSGIWTERPGQILMNS